VRSGGDLSFQTTIEVQLVLGKIELFIFIHLGKTEIEVNGSVAAGTINIQIILSKIKKLLA
jgi:hypothetical protein